MTTRKLERVIASIPASDGAGVKLRRSLGASQLTRHDPFLMLDEFSSDNPDDYIAGFPGASASRLRDRHLHARRPHAARGPPRQPRRPEERRRAVDDRRARHHPFRDAAAERRPHARLPALDQPAGEGEDEAGRLSRHSVERDSRQSSTSRRQGEGHRRNAWRDVAGPIHGGSTDPYYFDVHLEPGAVFEAALPAEHNAFVYVYEGDALVGEERKPLAASQRRSAVLWRCDPRARRRRRARESCCSPASRCASRSCSTVRS